MQSFRKKSNQQTQQGGTQGNNADSIAANDNGSSSGSDKGNDNSNDEDSKQYYTVISRAYFHDKPDPDTKRDAFITHWNNSRLTALEETNDFIYVVFKNNEGQISKGWLKKSDLRLVGGQ